MEGKIVTLAKAFVELRTKHAEQEKILKQLSTEWDALETELLDAMVEEGVSSVKIEGIGLFSMSTSNYLSVNAANTGTFYAYLKESGNGGLLKEYVNPKTLTAFLKEHLESLKSEFEAKGLDQVEARNTALEYLKEKGAAYFTKRGVSFRGEK